MANHFTWLTAPGLAALSVLHGTTVEVATPGVLARPFRCACLFGQTHLPHLVAVGKVGPVVKRVVKGVHFHATSVAVGTQGDTQQSIRSGAAIEQEAQHRGVHIQHRHE